MSNVCAISAGLVKKAISLSALTSNSPKTSPFVQILNSLSRKKISLQCINKKTAYDPMVMMGSEPAERPQEIHTAPPLMEKPEVPSEVAGVPNVPDFDPIPPEKPADWPPISPGPGPEFPGPPNPSTPRPESPKPPSPSPPGKPEVFPPRGPDIDPPHGPDVIPPKPSEPGFPHPPQPDIPPPIYM